MEQRNLITKERDVYNHIKANSELGLWTSVFELAQIMHCNKRQIRRYVQRIRENSTIQKIILTDYSKGYKLMSEDDEFELLSKTKIKILKELKRYYKDVDRYNKHNQNKITFTKYERDFFESLIGGSQNV